MRGLWGPFSIGVDGGNYHWCERVDGIRLSVFPPCLSPNHLQELIEGAFFVVSILNILDDRFNDSHHDGCPTARLVFIFIRPYQTAPDHLCHSHSCGGRCPGLPVLGPIPMETLLCYHDTRVGCLDRRLCMSGGVHLPRPERRAIHCPIYPSIHWGATVRWCRILHPRPHACIRSLPQPHAPGESPEHLSPSRYGCRSAGSKRCSDKCSVEDTANKKRGLGTNGSSFDPSMLPGGVLLLACRPGRSTLQTSKALSQQYSNDLLRPIHY